MKPQLTRREIVEKCVVRGLLVAGVSMSTSRLSALWQQGEHQAHKPTPENDMGPFFKKGAPDSKTLSAPGDPGMPLRVSGKVVDTRGDLLNDARLEIWHADYHGHYDISGYRYRARLAVSDAADY